MYIQTKIIIILWKSSLLASKIHFEEEKYFWFKEDFFQFNSGYIAQPKLFKPNFEAKCFEKQQQIQNDAFLFADQNPKTFMWDQEFGQNCDENGPCSKRSIAFK